MPQPISLHDCAVDETVVIHEIAGETHIIERLLGMGLHTGISVTILRNEKHTPLLLKVGNRRIAVQCGETLRITATQQ